MKKEFQIYSGVRFPAAWHPLLCQLFLFRFAPKMLADPFWRPEAFNEPEPMAYCGTGRFDHVKAFAEIGLPKSFEFQDYSNAALEAFSTHQWTACTGAGGTSKSSSAALYALMFSMCAPFKSKVLIASTSIEGARKRIFRPISAFFAELKRTQPCFGEYMMVNSPRPVIRPGPKDMSNGIFVVAVAGGEEEKGIAFLKGDHPQRVLLVVDELDSVGQAVVEVTDNLQIGTEEFQVIALGNDPSLFNPLGKLMEPAEGFASLIARDADEWTSKNGVHCLRFDGFKSPNIRDGDKWKGIIRQRDIDAIVARNGGNMDAPGVWIQVRGWHPPESAESTVLTESLLDKFHCRESVIWQRSFILSALLDPAFGGDRCVFKTMARGLDIFGKMRLCFKETIEFTINAADTKTPPEYQIAAKVKALCNERNIPPEEFIMDGTGRSGASTLQVEWSPRINVCQFGGSASNLPVTDDDPRPASELYDRRITELYFAFRQFVIGDMIRGLDLDTARELCSRRYEMIGTGEGKKSSVESKKKLKSRGNPSCDLADATVIGCELARLKGLAPKIESKSGTAHARTQLQDFAAECDFDAHDTYADALADYD